MILIRAIPIFVLFAISYGESFSKFEVIKDTEILDNHPIEGVLVEKHYSSSSIFCILECNRSPNCAIVSFDNANRCTLYNDLISLVHTTKNFGSTIYSKMKLPFCNRLSYHVQQDNICPPKKPDGQACSSSIECMDWDNFDCYNNICQCFDTSKK